MTLNSSPFAACSVIRLTRLVPSLCAWPAECARRGAWLARCGAAYVWGRRDQQRAAGMRQDFFKMPLKGKSSRKAALKH
eukprot:363500-Chlamydomonas_euryale.AAC.5